MKLFKKEERSSFSYWFAHLLAFNMVAVLCGAWKFKYLFHDFEKPWLKLIWPYKKVQSWHRTHNNHHLEYPGKIDWEAWAIDNECGRFTKENAPLTCRDHFELRKPDKQILRDNEEVILKTLEKLGL